MSVPGPQAGPQKSLAPAEDHAVRATASPRDSARCIRCTLVKVPDVGTPYTVWIVPAKKFKPVAVTIDGFSTELTATLREPGRVCEGRILLEGSNTPIPNARVRITLPNHCSAPEVYTDEEGRFRLTNLPDAQVSISLWPAPEGYRCDVIGEIPLAPDGSTVVYFKKAESH